MKKIVKTIFMLMAACLSAITLCACFWEQESPSEKTYKIMYSYGSDIYYIEVKQGELYTMGTLPKKEGYEFIGLYDAEEGGEQYVNSLGVSTAAFSDKKDIVLYPRFKAKSYTFVLDYCDAEKGEVDRVSADYDSQVPDLPAHLRIKDKPYMNFAGWYTSKSDGTKVAGSDGKGVGSVDKDIASLASNGTIRLYARFEKASYTLTFYGADRQTVVGEATAVHGNDFSSVDVDVSIDGKIIIGWVKADGVIFSGSIESDISLYPKFGAKVSFETDNGVALAPEIYAVGEEAQLPIPQRKNYRFIGWSVDGVEARKEFFPEQDITLIALWERTHYEIVFDTDGGNSLESISVRIGESALLPTPTRANYAFVRWEDSAGDGMESSLAPTSDMRLKAVWKRSHYVVSFDGASYSPQSIRIGDVYTLPTPSRENYSFEGWFDSSGKNVGSTISPTADITLTARWKRSHYVVSFDTNGGNALPSQSVKIGESISLPTPTKDGYEFTGWYDVEKKVGGSLTPSEDIRLTAHWIGALYEVTYDAQGGKTPLDDKGQSIYGHGVRYGEQFDLIVPARSGYTFDGWYTAASGGTALTGKDGKGLKAWAIKSNTTAYAHWIKLGEIEVSFSPQNCGDGNGYDPSKKASEADDRTRHNNFEMVKLIVENVTENDGVYSVPNGSTLSLKLKIMEDPTDLPINNGEAQKKDICADDFKDRVQGTDIVGKTIGRGAYFVRITYTDGTETKKSAVDILNGKKKGDVIDLNVTTSAGKKIASVEVIVVYEIYTGAPYSGVAGVFGDWWNEYTDWRCETTLKFE